MSNQPPYPLHESVLDRIDPEYAAFYNKHIIDKQQVHLQPVEASRSSGILIPGSGPLQPVASTIDYAIRRKESEGPDVKVRCFTPIGDKPENGWPVCIYYHGGGWVLGTIDTENVIASHLCARGKGVVVAVDYRLAPENPFPAAVHDSWEAVLWVMGEGKQTLGLDTSKLATGGSSAGANLAAIMCQRAADRGSPKFSIQLLSVPVMDNTADATNNVSWKENQHSPAQGDFSKLPPACFVVGELDVLRSEGEQFAKKLQDAGVKAELNVMKGQPHPFIAMDAVLEAGSRAITLFCDALYKTMYEKW
ncbi:hypothetical protein FOC1_g10003885 [Fusarium oxysporum f. sp. cubense race 1]|uniref:Alpha/beta hydrolase fold-3 domain-containing protein n=1 Tax=Fusarium oxysporum f. sp. cubense (strain race 1) TaxID=1229664 RepID=N4V3X6_FUSC1|nr:hypothetical protein FOC1_g10003885 [Fusarium oxysporum f. sp. cubense race 1]